MRQLFLTFLVCIAFQANAQKLMTKTGSINFSATTPVEKIEGTNKSVACLLDSKTGALDLIVQVKSFVFEKQLMQEHFNENYMESDKFPKSSFKGSITNLSAVNFSKDGEYNTDVAGKLTIHGVTNDIKSSGRMIIKGGKATLKSIFNARLSDYKIEIPGAVKDKISKDVKITVNCTLDAMK